MRLFALSASLGFAAVFAAGCGSNVCDRSADFDPGSKRGNCPVEVPDRVLGNSCPAGLSSCSDTDKKALDDLMGCWEGLRVCASGDEEGWNASRQGCYARVAGLTEACREAIFAGRLPTPDAGAEDAGVDAGVQPDTENAGALDIFATADETTVALAWRRSQPGIVSLWEIYPSNAADLRLPALQVSIDGRMFAEDTAEANEKRKYFMAGYDDAGELVQGDPSPPDAGVDSGTPMCGSPFDCPINRVCDLGSCVEVACATHDECPGGYLCHANSNLCERVIMPDGGVDAGVVDAGVELLPRPFVSEQIEITTGAPQYSPDRVVSAFPATTPQVAAFDTARAFVAMEQEGQIFGYHTEDRGKTFKPVSVDTTGRFPRLAYEPKSDTLFTCYSATHLAGVRIRASATQGKTWKQAALDLVNPMPADGGFATPILDCAIAAWQDGTALVAAIEGGDTVQVWTVNKDLQVIAGPEKVFESTATLYSPSQIAIATLPEEFQVHVVMTVTRTSAITRSKVIGMYRDTTTSGGFVGPKFIGSETAPYNYTQPAVVVDPVTKRGFAAFVSDEGSANLGGTTIYASMWFPKTPTGAGQAWATGSDLQIFVQNPVSKAFYLFPDRTLSQKWSALSPSVAVDKKGRITLGFLAGEEVTGVLTLNVWAVGFGFDAYNERLPASPGWFLPPATKVSTTRAAKLSGKELSGPMLTADQQISTWLTFVEGVGALGDQANRPVIISRPR